MPWIMDIINDMIIIMVTVILWGYGNEVIIIIITFTFSFIVTLD